MPVKCQPDRCSRFSVDRRGSTCRGVSSLHAGLHRATALHSFYDMQSTECSERTQEVKDEHEEQKKQYRICQVEIT